MKKVIISPYSRQLRKFNLNDIDRINPKNYPYWKDVISQLRSKNYYVIQVGVSGEGLLGANEERFNLSLKDLRELLLSANGWASVDNFFNHFATYYKKKGVVIFGHSDPKIYGYAENINLLKDRSYLRKDQFCLWEQDTFDENCFVAPEVVVSAIQNIAF